MVNEGGSVVVARRLRETAAAAGAPALVLQALERLESDELLHHGLAVDVVRRLGGAVPRVPSPAPLPHESPARSLLQQVIGALCVCESVSAARYAAVRGYTDLETPRAWLELLLRDEVAHGELGFALLPFALELAEPEGGRALAEDELRLTFRELEHLVGMNAGRTGGPPPPRPQPASNPGVVEPAIDAWAFYDAAERTLIPRLEAHGLAAREAWAARIAEP